MLHVYQRPVDALRDEMDRIFSGVLGTCGEGPEVCSSTGRLALDVWEEEDHFAVQAELPGVRRDEVEIETLGRKLTIKGNWQHESESKTDDAGPETEKSTGRTYHRRERRVGNFERVLSFPTEIDTERVEAKLADGVLTLTVPKAASAKARKIELKGE